MNLKKATESMIVLMLMVSLLTGCGSSSVNSGGSTGGKETATTVESSGIEAESEKDLDSDDAVVNKQSLLKEADVDISVADAQISDGQVGFTLYFSNEGAARRIIYGKELLVNGFPVSDLVVEEHDSIGSSTSSYPSAFLDSDEESWSVLTMHADEVKSGDTVRIDYEMEVNDGDSNTLLTKYLEFGITAEGEILLGEDLEVLNLAQSRNIEAETFPEVVFYDKNGIRIIGEGFTLNGKNERIIHLTVENNASFEVRVRGGVAIVDGYLGNIDGRDLSVPAGETVSGEFALKKSSMDTAGIRTIHEMTLNWHISGEGIDYSEDPTDMVSVTTDKDSVIDERDTDSFKELYNADGIVAKVDPQRYTDPYGSDYMYILWENNTEELLYVDDIIEHSGGDVTMGSADLYPNSKLWLEIRVRDGDIYYVRATHKENWERIFESEHITVE